MLKFKRIQIMKNLDQLFSTFQTGIRSAIKPREYLKEIGLDSDVLRIGYNSAQFHHGKPQELKDHYEGLGILKKLHTAIKKEETAYNVFGSRGLIFPLLDRHNAIVNYFAIRFDLDTPIEEYLNDEGIYPSYPHPNTARLYITPTLIDGASLLQSKALGQGEAILALHEGKLLEHHKQAINQIKDLKEIIIIKR